MKTKVPQWHKRFVLATAWLLLGPIVYIMAQAPLYGPEDPPPKESFITFTGSQNDGQIGRSGGKEFTFTNITLANTSTVYWTTLNDEVKLSMDGGSYSGSEIMDYTPELSDLPTGLLVWTGTTTITIWPYGGTNWISRNLYTKLILSFYDQNNQAVPLVDPSVTGLEANTGGAVLVTNSDMVFKVRVRMMVSENGSTYFPHLDYFDDQQTSGILAYSSWDYGFYWENDPPELLSNTGANVDEEDTVYINNVMLAAEDVESDPDELFVILDPRELGLLPAHGKMMMDGEMLLPGDSLSMEELTNAMICYVHDGSETIKDSLAFSIADSDGSWYRDDGDSIFYFHIAITPVDDPPVVETNAGATIDEDSVLVLTDALLLTTDPESDASKVTYTLDPNANSDYPMNGIIKLNDVPVNEGGTFTQADINSGKVVYDHNGSETLADGFVFKVEDEYGHAADNNGSEEFFFNITINPVNDDPLLTKNLPLELDEGGTGIVGNMFLAASDAESSPEDITFTLDPNSELEEPFYGKVFLNGVELNDGEGFTMADVNNNHVSYQHDGTEGHTDFFLFNVTDPHGGVAHDGEYKLFHFNFIISNVNDPPTLENPIDDHSTRAEEAYSFTFPENTFHDVDEGDELTYDAMLDDDSDLPDWLDFDGDTRTFSGTPQVADMGTLAIEIVAKDMENMEVSDVFNLTINSPVNVQNSNAKAILEIGPNPFTDVIHIKINSTQGNAERIVIYNLLGDKTVIQPEVALSFDVDMRTFPAGVYFVSAQVGKEVFITKLLKK